jgi:hypothetical protein
VVVRIAIKGQSKLIAELDNFLSELGNLHDCTITRLEWKPDNQSLIFEIRDIYFNFEGLPEYKGPKPATITLEQAQLVEGEINALQLPLWIYEFSLSLNNEIPRAIVSFWPEGKIEIAFGRVTFPRLD